MSFRKYLPLTTNCKCAMKHQIFYQEESENFPNFHQSAAGSRHMVEPVVQCVDGMNHCHMPPCETSPAPARLTWKPLVHFSSCCWRKLDDNRDSESHDAIMNNDNLQDSVWTGNVSIWQKM